MTDLFDYSRLDSLKFRFKNRTVTNSKGRKYTTHHLDNTITFDIETSTVYKIDGRWVGYDKDDPDLKYKSGDPNWKNKSTKYTKADKCTFMYVWQVDIVTERGKHCVFLGRTWDDFREFLGRLVLDVKIQCITGIVRSKLTDKAVKFFEKQSVNKPPKIHIWIHNLGFEFHNMLNMFTAWKVFARQAHKPMKAEVREVVYDWPIEFHDTVCLTNKSLKQWGKDDQWAIQKLDEPGDYYFPVRTPKTILTDENIQYSVNDVKSLACGVEGFRKRFGSIADIPMTQTSITRREYTPLLHSCEEWMKKVEAIMACMDYDTHCALVAAYSGGWTHANCRYTNQVIRNLICHDLSSSYPAVMCYRKFPLSPFEKVDDYTKYINVNPEDAEYIWFAKIKIYGFKQLTTNTYLSRHKVRGVENKKIEFKLERAAKNKTDRKCVTCDLDNGKVREADAMNVILTDLDYYILKNTATWDREEIVEFYVSKAERLPECFIRFILDKYNKKTQLKGVEDRKSEYNEAKQIINGIYGCTVTNLYRDAITFGFSRNHKYEWYVEQRLSTDTTDENLKAESEMAWAEIQDHEIEKKSPLPYQIGVWVTAWARYALWFVIMRCDRYVVYCDTDSVKALDKQIVRDAVSEYNRKIDLMIKETSEYIGCDPSLFYPKDPRGIERKLGIFEREADAIEFKTLGAKRYCYTYLDKKTGEIKLCVTVAGLPKGAGTRKIKNVDDFKPGVVWDATESDKLICYYNDNQVRNITVTDLNGTECLVDALYGVSLVPTSFDLELSSDYDLLLDILSGWTMSEIPEAPNSAFSDAMENNALDF